MMTSIEMAAEILAAVKSVKYGSDPLDPNSPSVILGRIEGTAWLLLHQLKHDEELRRIDAMIALNEKAKCI